MIRVHQNSFKTTSVIFVVFQTGNSANGGVESISQVIERLQNIQPIVITQLETPVTQRWRDAAAETQVWQIPYQMGSSFYSTSLITKLRRLYSLFQTNYQMFQLVKAKGCSVVHCNDPSALWHTVLGAKLAGANVVFNIRDTKATDENYGWKWRIAFQLSDRQLVLSKEMKNDLLQRLPVSSHRHPHIDFIYSIVNRIKFYPASINQRENIRDRLGILPETFALGYVATFNPKKAQLNFIEQVAPCLQQSLPNLKIYFVGDFEPSQNSYAKQCLDAVKRLSLESNITFIGYSPTVSDWYKAIDLTVIASRQEGLARCMIESLACGTPVISFDVCSAKEILEHYDCGYVVSQGNYQSLIRAILDLAQDSTQRQRLGKNGISVAKQLFNSEVIVQQYEMMYRTLAASSKAFYCSSQQVQP